MRYLFLLIILYLCFNFVTLGQEVNIEFEKKPYWVENFDKKGGLDDKLWGSKTLIPQHYNLTLFISS